MLARILGREPNQGAINAFLGKFAYKNKITREDIEGLEEDSLQAIDKILNSNAIVSAFVYDTTKDFDGGAWTTLSQHTSWWKEQLNTATRGATRDFPRVALIAAEADKVTIYDATVSGCPMWMVFIGGTSNYSLHSGVIVYISVRNGVIYVATNNDQPTLDFIKDATYRNTNNGTGWSHHDGIDTRNDVSALASTLGYSLSSNVINALAITQDSSGNNIVYVGSDGGLDRIYKGEVSSWTDSGNTVTLVTNVEVIGEYVFYSLDAGTDGKIIHAQNIGNALVDGRFFDTSLEHYTGDKSQVWSGLRNTIAYADTNSIPKSLSHNAITTNRSLTLIRPNPESWGHGLLAQITNERTSGYMYGDIRGAWLGESVTRDLDGTTQMTDDGEFTQADGALLSPYDGWSSLLSTLSIVSNRLVGTVTTSNMRICSGEMQLTVGKTYNLTIENQSGIDIPYIRITDGFDLADGTNSYAPVNNTFTNGDKLTFPFIALTSVARLVIGGYSGTTSLTIDNISVKEAIPDTSYKNNALTVEGTGLSLSPVNTGCELQAVSGFSATNYLYQAYNSDLDFGTGDFYIGFWFKTSGATGNDYIYQRYDGVGQAINIAQIDADTIQCYISATEYIRTVRTFTDNEWHNIIFCRDSGIMKVYIEGIHETNTTGVDTTITDLTVVGATVTVGQRYTVTSEVFSGSLALLRIGAGAPTASQIADIHKYEKELFIEGTQFTTPDLSIEDADFDTYINTLKTISLNGSQSRSDGSIAYYDSDNDGGTVIAAEKDITLAGG